MSVSEQIRAVEERRARERFNLHLTRSVQLLGSATELPIFNVSCGGISLLSPRQFESDELLTIAYRDVRVPIRVVNCIPVGCEERLGIEQYRLNATLEIDDSALLQYIVTHILS